MEMKQMVEPKERGIRGEPKKLQGSGRKSYGILYNNFFFLVTLSTIEFTNIVIPTQSKFIQNANHWNKAWYNLHNNN